MSDEVSNLKHALNIAETWIEHHQNHCDDLIKENAALRDSLNYAETLLCNSLPMPHCSQSEWDEIIRKWRDQKHAIDAARKEAQP